MAEILYDTSRQSFTAAPLATLMVSGVLPVDMYLRAGEDAPPILYREKRLELPPDEIERLTARGVETVFIPTAQLADYQQYLCENVAAIIADESVPLERRAQFLCEAGRGMLCEAFKAGSTAKTVQVAQEISGHMAILLARNPVLVRNLLDVLRHDYHTYTHSYNVASYAVLLAKGLGIHDAAALQEVSLGGLLHDLGKLRIPQSILTKGDRLTDWEWSVLRQHPTDGFKELCPRDDFSYAQLMMVYQHHEKLDGSGYPVGVGEGEIHEHGRLCAVVDIFEALTSFRPYRSPISAAKALKLLEAEGDVKLDGEMVQCWKSLVNTRSGKTR